MLETIEYRFHVTGMDCPSCASKIEKLAQKFHGVESVKVSVSSQIMTISVVRKTDIQKLKTAINQLGYELAEVEKDDYGKELIKITHAAPAYKRALAIVVILNLGYGVIEMMGGFISDSQALKADALDFLGDGLITMIGLLAVGWSLLWRARTALIQGIFLGSLGLGVLIATAYRVIVLQQPEAELMGIYGAIALSVNIVSALILIPHRAGDSNVRAVWLFSRNDALGNAAVVVAAGLVAWTKTPWPDLFVAVIIAVLFLHSSYSIIKDSLIDIKQDRQNKLSNF